ncbi:uncharacterized protein LOC143488971 [Brachyhypopomus gauderio]|uniref:uncharacterized protein LOC143488971 n=1 Tax=Brachyhypopomus gauderio TaxID=698409 RepID=UPI004041A386
MKGPFLVSSSRPYWTLLDITEQMVAMFLDLAVGFTSRSYEEHWLLSGRRFLGHRITEEEEEVEEEEVEEEEEDDVLKRSWAGRGKPPHHGSVSPDRTRSLSLENGLPVSFLIRSSALEDLTTVGDRLKENEEASASTGCPEQILSQVSIDSSESYHDDVPQATTCQPQLLPQRHVQKEVRFEPVRGPSLTATMGASIASAEAKGTLGPHDPKNLDSKRGPSQPSEDSAGTPGSTHGSPARKSLMPVAQFKGLCCHVLPTNPSEVPPALCPSIFASVSSLAVQHCLSPLKECPVRNNMTLKEITCCHTNVLFFFFLSPSLAFVALGWWSCSPFLH